MRFRKALAQIEQQSIEREKVEKLRSSNESRLMENYLTQIKTLKNQVESLNQVLLTRESEKPSETSKPMRTRTRSHVDVDRKSESPTKPHISFKLESAIKSSDSVGLKLKSSLKG